VGACDGRCLKEGKEIEVDREAPGRRGREIVCRRFLWGFEVLGIGGEERGEYGPFGRGEDCEASPRNKAAMQLKGRTTNL